MYHQQAGAPIGTRIACAAANLVMEFVWGRMRTFFKDSGAPYKLWMALNFVDDAKCWVTTFQLGTRFTNGKFEWSAAARTEDEGDGLTLEDITFREVLVALRSVSEHLYFTSERPSDFGDHWVPTLDFKVGQDFQKNR